MCSSILVSHRPPQHPHLDHNLENSVDILHWIPSGDNRTTIWTGGWEMQVISFRMRTAGYLRRFPGRGPSTTKEQQPKNMIPESLFYWEDLLKTTRWRSALPQLRVTAHRRRGQYACDCGEGMTCRSTHILGESGWESGGTDVSLKDFRAFLPMRSCKNWVHKFPLEII